MSAVQNLHLLASTTIASLQRGQFELTTSLPSGPSVFPNTILASRQFPLGRIMPMSGMIRSAASDDTTLPTAPPTITATARAKTLFFRRNSLNPLDHR